MGVLTPFTACSGIERGQLPSMTGGGSARGGVSRGAPARMETKGAKTRAATRRKIAEALEVRPEQLTE